MTKTTKTQNRKFRWNWFDPARHVFFAFYVLSLIGFSVFIHHQALPKMSPLEEALSAVLGASNYSSVALGAKTAYQTVLPPGLKTTAFQMTVRHQNDLYSYIAGLDAEGRITGIKKIEMPELMPRIVLPDEELFLLSLEGRKVADLPRFESSRDFKTNFLIELQKIMLIYSERKEQLQ